MKFKIDFPPEDTQNQENNTDYYLEKNLESTTETESEYVDSIIEKLNIDIEIKDFNDIKKTILELKEMDLRVLLRNLGNNNLIKKENAEKFLEIIPSITERLCISYKNLLNTKDDSNAYINIHEQSMNNYLKDIISKTITTLADADNFYPTLNKLIDSYLNLFNNYPEDADRLFEPYTTAFSFDHSSNTLNKVLNFKNNQDTLVSKLPEMFYLALSHNLGVMGTSEIINEIDDYQNKNDKPSSNMIMFINKIYTYIFNRIDDWGMKGDEENQTKFIKDQVLGAVEDLENKTKYSYFLNYLTKGIKEEMERSLSNNSQCEILGATQIEPFEIQPGIEVILLKGEIFQKTNKLKESDSITDFTKKYDPEYSYSEFKERVKDLRRAVINNSTLERYKGVKMHRFGNISGGGEFIEIDPRDTEKLALEYQSKLFFDEKVDMNKILGNLNKEQIKEYLLFLSPIIRIKIEDELNIKIKDFSYKKQLYILDMLKDTSVEGFSRVKDFSQVYGYPGLNTFLSIEQVEKGKEKEMGDKILALGDSEKLPEEITKKIFKKYGEIIDTADNTEEEIRKIFGDKDISAKVLSSVKDTLLKRGAKMLSDLGDKVLDPKFKVNEVEILKELDEIKEETIILGQSYVGLYKEGIKVPIENITEIEKISAKDLPEKEKEELVKVYKNGRPKTTYENEDHLKLLTEEFRQELENQNTKILNIRFNGEIIIFAVVDQKEKDTIYIGGLTFVDEVRNSAIAVSAMEAVLEEFKDYNIKALVDSKNSILLMYQKRFGFKIVKELPREENAGELYYEIERPKNMKEEKTIGEKEELKEAA